MVRGSSGEGSAMVKKLGVKSPVNDSLRIATVLGELPGSGQSGYRFFPLTTPLTHTSFNGDSFSDVGTATKIENTGWSSAIPSNAQALLIQAITRDSGTWGTNGLYFAVGPSSSQANALVSRPAGGDVWVEAQGVVPCVDGDIYYEVEASGTSTLECYLFCWGYWI